MTTGSQSRGARWHRFYCLEQSPVYFHMFHLMFRMYHRIEFILERCCYTSKVTHTYGRGSHLCLSYASSLVVVHFRAWLAIEH